MSFQRIYTVQDALEHGHVYQVENDTCIRAASLGHLHALYWLREQRCLWESARIAEAATKAGHHCIVERMLDVGGGGGVASPDRLRAVRTAAVPLAVP
jgi:hypothetical protein